MSFLTELQRRKRSLKPTDTLVTQADGRRFLVSKYSTFEVTANQYGFVVDNKPDNIPAKIIGYVLLGSQDCCELNILNEYSITYILSIGIEPPVKYRDIVYKYLNFLDLPESNIENVLKECIPFIEMAREKHCNILVHCNAGVSRSASVVIGYLILVHHYSYLDAYNVVKAARCSIKPNIGFETQLQHLSKS